MCRNVGAVSVISGLALFIGKLWVMSVAGIGGYYYMQGQYDDKVTNCPHFVHGLLLIMQYMHVL